MDKKTKNLIEVAKLVLAEATTTRLTRFHCDALQKAIDAFEHDEVREILCEVKGAINDFRFTNYIKEAKSAYLIHKAICSAINAWFEKHAEQKGESYE